MVIRQYEQVQQSTEDQWELTGDQMIFMLQHHNAIEIAYADDDIELLRQLADSDAYKAVFGDMGWDEAYDRYETMLENADGDA